MKSDLIKYMYRYNAWATEQLLGAMEQLTPEEYNAPGCSGHGSIRDTLAHFLSTQYGWFSWYDGSMTPEKSFRQHIFADDVQTIAQARERWIPIAKQTDKYINSLTEEQVNAFKSWKLPNGAEGGAILWRLLLHTANHGTHTRAQIVAAIRRAGHNPGNVELLNYIMSNPK